MANLTPPRGAVRHTEQKNVRPFATDDDDDEEYVPVGQLNSPPPTPPAPAAMPESEPEPEAPAVAAPAPAPAPARAAKKSAPEKKTPDSTRKVGRPKKEEARFQTTILFPPALHDVAQLIKLKTKVSISNIFIHLFSDMADHTYECKDPSCNHRFIARSSDAASQAPAFCPYCGGQKIKRIKYRDGES